MGVALMILGIIAIGSSFIATLATVLGFGILLLLGALFQVITALWGRSWRGFFLHLLGGVLYPDVAERRRVVPFGCGYFEAMAAFWIMGHRVVRGDRAK